MSETNVIDPDRAKARAELAELQADISLHEKAEAVVRAQIAQIQGSRLSPIEKELQELRQRLERAQARADLADYMALGATTQQRHQRFEQAQAAALHAYRRAQTTAGAPRQLIEEAWTAVLGPFHSLGRHVGVTLPNGTLLTQEQHEASFYGRFAALRERLEELVTIPLEERLRLGAEAAMRAQFGR